MKTVVILSGGLDSSVLLGHLHCCGDELVALSVDYGQRHHHELNSAAVIARTYGIPHRVLDIHGIRQFLGGSSQTDPNVAVPHGHYAEESMKLTVVPNRNMFMLSAAAAWAIALKYDRVAIGAHAGDHAIYPDCRKEFYDALNGALALADWHKVSVVSPFVGITKTEIVKMGARLGVPMELTYSCYEGHQVHCGKCGTCTERKEAFQDAGINDPTIYTS